jgi:hypothetical protein
MIDLVFNLDFIPQMIAAIGVLIAAGSLAWGLWSYRMIPSPFE